MSIVLLIVVRCITLSLLCKRLGQRTSSKKFRLFPAIYLAQNLHTACVDKRHTTQIQSHQSFVERDYEIAPYRFQFISPWAYDAPFELDGYGVRIVLDRYSQRTVARACAISSGMARGWPMISSAV